jgi:hypothetical protein
LGEELSARREVGARVPKKALHQIFEESCAQFGDRPFTDFLDKVMTFRDYKEASDQAAAGFQKLGVKPGVNVGLYLPNTPHYLIAFFGVLKAGGRVVNYSPLDAARELEFKIGDSETDILVTLDVAGALPEDGGDEGQDAAQEADRGLDRRLPAVAQELALSHRQEEGALGLAARRLAHVVQGPSGQRRQVHAASGGREPVGRGGAAAIYRRHHRAAEGCHADARLHRRGDEPGPVVDHALHHARHREGRVRAAAVPHLCAVGNHAGRGAQRQPADPLPAARHRHDRQ